MRLHLLCEVFQQIHNILMAVPPENITAMFEAVREP